jgi:hypothetical protein
VNRKQRRAAGRGGNPHDECAKDLQVGLKMGGPLGDEMPMEEAVLERGGVVVLACPICEMEGRPHPLSIRKVGGQYIVLPTVSARTG